MMGKYALSVTSRNGNISIHTDVNMICGEKVFNTTCLGGFTQNSTGEIIGSTKLYEVRPIDSKIVLFFFFLVLVEEIGAFLFLSLFYKTWIWRKNNN